MHFCWLKKNHIYWQNHTLHWCVGPVLQFHIHTTLLKHSCLNACLLFEEKNIPFTARITLYFTVMLWFHVHTALLRPSCQNTILTLEITCTARITSYTLPWCATLLLSLLFMFTRHCFKPCCQKAFLLVKKNVRITLYLVMCWTNAHSAQHTA